MGRPHFVTLLKHPDRCITWTVHEDFGHLNCKKCSSLGLQVCNRIPHVLIIVQSPCAFCLPNSYCTQQVVNWWLLFFNLYFFKCYDAMFPKYKKDVFRAHFWWNDILILWACDHIFSLVKCYGKILFQDHPATDHYTCNFMLKHLYVMLR